MRLTEKELEDLVHNGEKGHFEGKDASGGLPDSLWETYSSFANTDGGVIVLGLQEVEHKLTIHGIVDPAALIKQFWDDVNNREKTNTNILVDHNVYSICCQGKHLVVIEVPRSNRRVRPVYIGKDVFEGCYRRNGEGDYKCSRDTVLAMLRDSCVETADTAIVESLTVKALNAETIQRYRMRFANHKPTHTWCHLSNEEFLVKIGAVRSDEDEILRPTIAGLVCFGNFIDIIATLPNYFVDYRECQSDETRWSDRVCAQDGTWSGNIFDFFFMIRDRLLADVKKPFAIADDNVSRIEDTDVHKSVRELLANALIHTDYYGRRGIVIEKRFRHLKFSNPGAMLMSVEDAVSGGNTEPRNTTIFNIFSLVEVGERSGMGLSNLLGVCDRYGFDRPLITETFDPDRTIVELEVESCKRKQRGKTTRHPYKTRTKPVQSTRTKPVQSDGLQDCSSSVKRTYAELCKDGTLTIRALSSKLNLNKDSVMVAVGTLVKHGYIRRVGSKRAGHWEVVK